jgi:hypothetical protein
MTITRHDLIRTIQGLQSLLPFAKQIDEAGLLMLWTSFPEQAKAQLTPEMLQYAACQRLIDPDPPKELAIHVQLLRYVYRLEDNLPNFQWGLKADLPARMASPSQFHGQQLSQFELDRLQGAPDHDAISPNGALAQIGWQP